MRKLIMALQKGPNPLVMAEFFGIPPPLLEGGESFSRLSDYSGSGHHPRGWDTGLPRLRDQFVAQGLGCDSGHLHDYRCRRLALETIPPSLRIRQRPSSGIQRVPRGASAHLTLPRGVTIRGEILKTLIFGIANDNAVFNRVITL